MNTYYIRYPRGFANEYTVAIARDRLDSAMLEHDGFERITRREALQRARRRDDDATEYFIGYQIGLAPVDSSDPRRDWLDAIA